VKPYIALPYVQRTPEWIEARRRLGITASEVGAACGVGRFGGPFDVYGFHKGLRPDLIPTEPMIWGTLLEDPVAQYGAKEVGIKVRRVNRLLQSRLYPWLLCSLDRWGSDGNLVEVKTTGEFAKDWGEAETDQIPDDPMCQVQTQMAVTGAPGCHVFALFAGQHFKKYFVPRDDEKIELIADITENLWDRIQRSDPPQIDGSEGAAAYLAERFKSPTGATIDLPEEARRLAFSYLEVNAEMKALEEQKSALANYLKNTLGDATQGVGGDVKVTWTPQAGSTYTVTKQPTRVLRVVHLEV
jgi:putative phage-type endonuclease